MVGKVGAIYAPQGGDFEFTKRKKDEINEADFLEQLQIMYVHYGDFRKRRDTNVPDELWNELLKKYKSLKIRSMLSGK